MSQHSETVIDFLHSAHESYATPLTDIPRLHELLLHCRYVQSNAKSYAVAMLDSPCLIDIALKFSKFLA